MIMDYTVSTNTIFAAVRYCVMGDSQNTPDVIEDVMGNLEKFDDAFIAVLINAIEAGIGTSLNAMPSIYIEDWTGLLTELRAEQAIREI